MYQAGAVDSSAFATDSYLHTEAVSFGEGVAWRSHSHISAPFGHGHQDLRMQEGHILVMHTPLAGKLRGQHLATNTPGHKACVTCVT